MLFKAGTKVISFEGDPVGSIDRVVIDPKTKEVSHIVVSKGLLFKEDKVVPVRLVDQTSEDQIRLRHFAGTFDDLPDFEETNYIILDEEELLRTPYQAGGMDYAVPYYPYPGIAARPLLGSEYLGSPSSLQSQPIIPETGQNIPDETVAVKQGSPVYSQDGKHLGELAEILVNDQNGQVTHFVLSQGVLVKRQKLIPMDWVENIAEDRLTLGVGIGTVDRLREYHSG